MAEMFLELAGRCLVQRGFAEKMAEQGAKATAEALHDGDVGDLTDEQVAAMDAAAAQPRMREIIQAWWAAYDELREKGLIPDAATESPWLP